MATISHIIFYVFPLVACHSFDLCCVGAAHTCTMILVRRSAWLICERCTIHGERSRYRSDGREESISPTEVCPDDQDGLRGHSSACSVSSSLETPRPLQAPGHWDEPRTPWPEETTGCRLPLRASHPPPFGPRQPAARAAAVTLSGDPPPRVATPDRLERLTSLRQTKLARPDETHFSPHDFPRTALPPFLSPLSPTPAPGHGPARFSPTQLVPRNKHAATCAPRRQARSTTHLSCSVADPCVSIPEPLGERDSVTPGLPDRRAGPHHFLSTRGTHGEMLRTTKIQQF